MKIAIIGGGVAGMAAFHLVRKYIPDASVTVFSQNIGGEFFNGGFKYIRSTEHVHEFVADNDDTYKLKKVSGCVFDNGFIQPFPGYVQSWPAVAIEYWGKTRGNAPFDDRCMNNHRKLENHWSNAEIAVKPKRTWGGIFKGIKESISEHHEQVEITPQVLEAIVTDFDRVIYTIPLHPLVQLYYPDPEEIQHTLGFNQLGILEFRVPAIESGKLWWDYMYIPDASIAPHRISRVVETSNGDDIYHAEFNTANHSFEYAKISLSNFIQRALDINVPVTALVNKGTLKGQLTYNLPHDFKEHVPETVELLGRYAQNDKRVTFDTVLINLYHNIIPHFLVMK